MKNKDFFAAIDDLTREENLSKELLMEALESGLSAAYKKHSGEARSITVKLNPDSATIRVFAYQTVVEEEKDEEGNIIPLTDGTKITLEAAREIKKTYKVGDTIQDEITPKDFGRVAASTAKQVIKQRLTEARRGAAFKEIEDKIEQLVTGIIRRVENGTVFIELSTTHIEGVLMPNDCIPGEKYSVNDRIKVFVKKLRETPRGTQAIVSRSAAGFVKRLFENEVPEIPAGLVTIKSIVREAGYRTKIAVHNEDVTIDALGACVGNKGIRVNSIISELNGEKIDIIEWSDDALEYIARALSPAKVLEVTVDDATKSAKVIVPDDKLSLAIGRAGQNVRLASKLTGWRIDVKSETAAKQGAKETTVLDAVMNDAANQPVGTDIDDLFSDIDIEN